MIHRDRQWKHARLLAIGTFIGWLSRRILLSLWNNDDFFCSFFFYFLFKSSIFLSTGLCWPIRPKYVNDGTGNLITTPWMELLVLSSDGNFSATRLANQAAPEYTFGALPRDFIWYLWRRATWVAMAYNQRIRLKRFESKTANVAASWNLAASWKGKDRASFHPRVSIVARYMRSLWKLLPVPFWDEQPKPLLLPSGILFSELKY
jgi:hypothetical protein